MAHRAPWLVLLFGLMIVPLGITTILFIVIQPVVLGTWSTLALVGGAAVLIQIPYSLDELLATAQFLRRRVRAGQPWLRVLFLGDTDELPAANEKRVNSDKTDESDEFDQPLGVVLKRIVGGGVSLPWNLALAGLIELADKLTSTSRRLSRQVSCANAMARNCSAHDNERTPALPPWRCTLRAKVGPRDELHDLSEQGLADVHGRNTLRVR